MKNKLYFLFVGLSIFLSLRSGGQIISTYAGNGTPGYSGDGGVATAAELDHAHSVAVDKNGNVYIGDALNSRVRKVDAESIITTIAGTGTEGYSGDGGAATLAEIDLPTGIAIDDIGNLYFADYDANGHIRKVDTFGIITTIAGGGLIAPSLIPEPATSVYLYHPGNVAIDKKGNLYITDADFVYRVNSLGMIAVYAGNGFSGYSGDGGLATSAEFGSPYIYDIAVDTIGNLYIADFGNNRIRKVDTNDIVTTFAGTGMPGESGDSGLAIAAELNGPLGVAADRYGNIFISDGADNRVRKINASGIITTVAGNGTAGFSGDGGPATSAELYVPWGLTTDASGNLYFCDVYNYRIRKVINHVPAFTDGGAVPVATDTVIVCENASISIDTQLSAIDSEVGQPESWGLYAAPAHGTAVVAYTLTSTGGLMVPSGLSYTPATGFTGTDSFRVMVCDGISSDTLLVRVTVNPLPSAGAIGGAATICAGDTVILSLTDTLGAGSWSSSDAAATITAGIATGMSAGTDTVMYIAANSCGADTATHAVVINPLPHAGVITGGTALCQGTSLTLADTAAGGTWSSNGLATITTGTVTAVNPGTDTITYIVTNSCGADTAIKTITIHPLPHAGPIAGAATICMGESTVLSDTAAGGAWSSSNAIVSITAGTVTATATGTDTISYIVTNSCGADTVIKTIASNPLPNAGTITGPDSVCQFDTVTLSASISGGAWSSSDSSIADVTGGLLIGLSAGTDNVRYIVSNSCGADTAVLPVVVKSHADCTEGVAVMNNEDAMTVYPNPSDGTFIVNVASLADEKIQIVIINVAGETVKTFIGKTNAPLSVNLNVAAGVYLLSTGSGLHAKVVVK